MRVASGLLGRPRRQLLSLLLLCPSLCSCQYLFGDFSEEPVRDGTGGDPGAPMFCAEGTSSCEGAQLLTCDGGFMSFRADCVNAELCDDSGAGRCLVCIDGEFECVDDQSPRRCEGGAWVDEPPCEDGLRCDPVIEQCAACRAGDRACGLGAAVLCLCLEDQTGWEAHACELGCTGEGFSDRCIDDISVPGAAIDDCSGIGN